MKFFVSHSVYTIASNAGISFITTYELLEHFLATTVKYGISSNSESNQKTGNGIGVQLNKEAKLSLG